MIDILLVAIIGGVAWCVASEGAWGAVFSCLAVIFAGLLAMNFFEPVANFLESSFSLSYDWTLRVDVIALVGLFALFTALIRAASLYLSPTFIITSNWAHEGARWSAGLLTGYVTMAFLLTALHTAPLPREFLGFRPERKNLFNFAAPDRQWLGFTQYVSEQSLAKVGQPKVFDGPRVTIPRDGDEIYILSSFPIRYAHRREQGASLAGSTPAAAVRSVERNAPAGGGNRSGSSGGPAF